MAYSYPAPTDIQELLYNSSSTENKLIFDFSFQEALNTPTAATLQIRNGNETAIGSTVAMTISASQAYTAIDTTNTTNYSAGMGYIADVVYTSSGGSTVTFRGYFDIVEKKLFIVLHDNHILEHDTGMASFLPSGETNFQKWITGSWREIRSAIRAMGNRPALLVDSFSLFVPHKHLTLSMFYRYCSKSPDDQWWMLANFHLSEFRRTFDSVLANTHYSSNGILPAGTTNLSQIRMWR